MATIRSPWTPSGRAARGTDEVVQLLRNRLLTSVGEYLLDPTFGVPWTDLRDKGTSAASFGGSLQLAIAQSPAVESVPSFTSRAEVVDGARQFVYEAEVVLDGGVEATVIVDPTANVVRGNQILGAPVVLITLGGI